MLVKPIQRSARLANNAVHRSLGRQSVTRDRDMKAMGEGSFGGEAEALLGVALPIAAMKKQQRRGAGAVRGEEIEAGARRIAIDEVEMIRHAGAERLAAAQPIREVSVAFRHGSGIVVRGVERLPIHRTVNDHAMLRQCWNWYRSGLWFPRAAQANSELRHRVDGMPDPLRCRRHVEMGDAVG